MVGTVACGLFTLTSVDTDASQASSLGTCLLFQEALSKLPWPRRLPVPFLPPRCSSKVSFRPRAPFWAGAPREAALRPCLRLCHSPPKHSALPLKKDSFIRSASMC